MNPPSPQKERSPAPSSSLRSTVEIYALAVLVAAAAGLVRYHLGWFFGQRAAFIFFYPAVMIAALMGGFGPALVATALSTMIAALWVLPSLGPLSGMPMVDAVSVLLFAALGCFIGFLSHLYHRSRQRAAAAERDLALGQSEVKYRELVENANSVIIRWNSEGTLTFFNEYAQAFFGYSEEEAMGRHASMLLPKNESDGVDLTTLVRDIVANPDRYISNVNENVCKDGRRVWVAWTNKPIYDAQGQVSEILAVGIDITRLKETEDALQNAREELELRVRERTAELQETRDRLVEQSRILEGFFTSTLTPLVLLDRHFNFIRVNEAYARACEKQVAEFPGRNHFEFYPQVENEAIFKKVVETRVPYHAVAKPFQFPDHPEWGTTYWNWTLTPLLDPSGEVEFLVFSLENVTEQVHSEQALRQAQKMEALGTLTGGIAHDFNNILAAMIGFAELVADDLPRGSRTAHRAQRIVQAGLRGRELVRQMHTFSRNCEQDRKPLQLSSTVKESLSLLRATIPSTIRLDLDARSESGFVMGDPVQIQQVLMNLAANAAYAMRENGGSLDIELSDFFGRPPGEASGGEPTSYMKLVVRDTGCGMPPDIMDKIFDPFFTTKEKGEGTGLGLSVVLGIVRQSNGHIIVESQPGRGSTFTIYFPKVAEGPEADVALPDDALPTGSERVLFVDDEDALVEMGEELLAELGYEVTSRTAGPQALELLRANPQDFDVLITDQTMPGMTGIELAREVAAIRPDLPVILCTGFSHAVNGESAKAAGMKAFLMKPLTRREIATTIRKVLDASAAS